MGSFPETYNGPNRLRSKRRLRTVQRLAKRFQSSYLSESWRERERAKKRGMGRGGEVEGKRGNASP